MSASLSRKTTSTKHHVWSSWLTNKCMIPKVSFYKAHDLHSPHSTSSIAKNDSPPCNVCFETRFSRHQHQYKNYRFFWLELLLIILHLSSFPKKRTWKNAMSVFLFSRKYRQNVSYVRSSRTSTSSTKILKRLGTDTCPSPLHAVPPLLIHRKQSSIGHVPIRKHTRSKNRATTILWALPSQSHKPPPKKHNAC
jgi:hypothetical protein